MVIAPITAFVVGGFLFSQLTDKPLLRTQVLAQTACVQGDANGDGLVTLTDFALWRQVFLSNLPTTMPTTVPTNPPNPSPTITTGDVPLTTVIAQGLNVPWALAFLPNGSILFTERPGRVRIIENGQLQTAPVATIAEVLAQGEGGLLGMTLHPQFATNGFVYLYYTYQMTGGSTMNRVVRMTYANKQLSAPVTIVDAIPGANIHNGGRIKFGPDGFLYIGAGDAADPSKSQDTASLAGKILRVTDTGAAAPGNPFNNRTYSYGHRNPQGLAWDSAGQLWESEHGSDTMDELNKITPGLNYGWPTIRGDQTQTGMEKPVAHSGTDTWAPSGMSIIGTKVYIASLRGAAVTELTLPGGTGLKQHFKSEFGRIRDVVTGPDGMLYISTSNSNADRIIKVNPNKL